MPMQAGGDDKLEFKTPGGWFAAQLFLSEGGMTTVKFDGFEDTDDEHLDAEKIRSFEPLTDHIRVISEQLQDAECGNVCLSKTVCALWKGKDDEREGWYDAVVTEVTRLPHTPTDEGEICTCSFTVTWRDGPDKDRPGENLTCESICLLSTKDVETHPLMVSILYQANRQERGKVQEGIVRICAAKVRRWEEDDRNDQSASLEEQGVRRFHRLRSKVTANSQFIAEEIFEDLDPIEHFELASEINDFSTFTSTVREIQDVRQDVSLEPRPAQLIRELDLSPFAAALFRETTGGIFSNPDALYQSEQAIDVGIQDVPLSSRSAEDNRPTKKMRGQLEGHDLLSPELIALRDRLLGNKSSDRVCEIQVQQNETTSPNANSSVYKNRVQQKTTTSTKPLRERRARTKLVVDPTENAECDVQPTKKETVKAKVDPLEEHHLSRRPSVVQVKDDDVKANTDSLQELHLSRLSEVQVRDDDVKANTDSLQELHLSRPSEVQVKKDKENDKANAKADPLQEYHLSSKTSGMEAKSDVIRALNRDVVLPPTIEVMKPELHCYSRQKKAENLAVASEAHRSKKVRITLEIDMGDESVSILEGGCLNRSLAGAEVPSSPSNYEGPLDSAACSKLRGKTSGPKSEVQRREELPGSVDESLGGPKKDPFLQAKIEERFRAGMRLLGMRLPRTLSGNEELMDSKPYTRLGSTLNSAICLSDEEEECVIPGNTTTTSPRGLASERSSGSDPFRDEQEGGSAHFQNRARNMSSFIKNVLMKPAGCIVLVDNLDLNVRDSDLREQLLKFCDKDKIQSVKIPLPHPQMKHAMGYVIFVDKEAADAAADVLTSFIIVSAKGKPWVVKRQGQEETYFQKTLDSTGDVMDGYALSSEKFKVLTRKHLSEYNAAKNRLRLFEKHREQSRLMLQRHAQEDDTMDTHLKPIV